MPSKEGQVAGRLLGDSGWTISRRVIGALLLRELLTRYGRNNIGFLWLFVEPMLFTMLITALWSALRTIHGSDIPIVAFAVTGYSSLLLWRNMPSRCNGALQSNAPLLFHRQVTIMDVYAARILLEWIATTTAFVVLSIGLYSVDLLKPPENIAQVLGGWMLLGWFGVGLGLTVGGLSEKFDIVGKLWPPLSYLLLPLSGVAYIVDALPTNIQEIVLWLPMLNALEYLREGWFGSMFTAHYDILYVMVCNLCLTFVGFSLVRQVGTDPSLE